MEILEADFYGNTPLNWGLALGVSTLLIVLAMLARPLLLKQFGERAKLTRTQVDDALVAVIGATQIWLIAALAVALGSNGLRLPPGAERAVNVTATLALFVQAGLWFNALLTFWLTRARKKALATDAGTATSLAALGMVGQVLVWTLILLLVLDNLGVNVTTLIAGLGIGGIAVALAAQNILGDVFASLSIVIDKPFVIGDFIIVDNYMGTVEHVGLKTTRIRSLDGEQIILSNGDLLKTRVRNYKRMYERRVVFPFRVRYDTRPEQLERIPALVRRLVESHKQTRFERSHFLRFGEGSFDFETVFWVLTPDYNVYMDIQQQLNLDLMREFERLDIEFALPIQVQVTTGANDEGTKGQAAARQDRFSRR